MKQAKTILRKLLYPPKEVLYFLSPVVFVALIFVFAVGKQGSWPAYLIYSMSVYSLIILVAALLQCFRCIKKHISGSKAVEKLSSYAAVNRYLADLSFKGKVSIIRE